MKRVFGKADHNPWRGVFGDCVQACIASIMDMSLEDVPHFMHDGCSGEEGLKRVNAFLAPKGYAAVVLQLDEHQRLGAPICHLLGGLNGQGDHHVVVACDMEPIHNPDTFANDFVQPEDWLKPCDGSYEVWLIVYTSKPAAFAEQLVRKEATATV